MKSNFSIRQLIQKADLVVNDLITDGGYLNPEQAKKFLIQAIVQSVAMKEATVMGLKSHTKELDRLRFAGTVLVGAEEGRELAEDERSSPDIGQRVLTTSLFKAEGRITREVLEDNIEGSAFEATIRREMGKAVSRDIEDGGLNGDTADTAITGKRGKLIRKLDGLRKLATSHTVDAGAGKIEKLFLKRAWKALPKEYRPNKAKMRFWVSSNADTDWRNEFSDRGTQVADAVLLQNRSIGWSGIQFTEVPLIPDDLDVGNDESEILLLEPKNATWGIWRRIRVETEPMIRAGALAIVISLRFGVQYAIEDAVVKIENLLTAG